MRIFFLSWFAFFSVTLAEWVPGDAPFINSWLLSGPFDEPVADQIYGLDSENDKAKEKSADKITPLPGKELGTEKKGLQKNKWQYFDDRLWNRNYDDYQDLYGYYKIKQGIDTRDKYVYAHSYVFSPVEREVQFRVGSSGSYKLFVNDSPLAGPTTPVEVKKDLTIQPVTLKAGWNKLLIQIKHTFTEDVNGNGVPIGKDHHVAYLGFYGRVTDENGNKIEGLEYSISGGETKKLVIDNQTLAFNKTAKTNLLPENNMPAAYMEWPYVWLTSKSRKSHSVSASPFRFMAGGGAPGYTWSLEGGSRLPAGLWLNPDGTMSGFVADEPGKYGFTVKVRDAKGETASKKFAITVKERPNKWFEEGRVGALSHCIPIINYFIDENFSADLWAERARRQGHSLVSIESLQQNYYWPSKFADPKHDRQKYLPKQENGEVVDGLRRYEQALRRYGIKFGLYYATEGGGLRHHSSDVFLQNVEDLINRYQPDYLYFDGPQAMRNANYDVMYSIIRDYSDDIIVNSNTNTRWGGEFGDADLRTVEASHIYGKANDNCHVKRTIMEPWKSVVSKHNPTPYYAKRDDYRQVAKEMVMNVGRGMVDNNDQMPVMSRGTNWDSPENVATRYPIAAQEYIDIREGLAAWFAPEGKPERHESTTGTMPYFLSGCGYEDDARGNISKFETGQGPAWGYATARDNNIYLHIVKGPDGKTGFEGIPGKRLIISPVADKVQKVVWLNEGSVIADFKQTGDSLEINLSGVSEDPVDTIIKIVTDNKQRKYKLTNLYVTGRQIDDSTLKAEVEGYMTFPALKAVLDKISFKSSNRKVASVNDKGEIRAGVDGVANIAISGMYEGVKKSEVLPVKVAGGKIHVNEPLVEAIIRVSGKEIYQQLTRGDAPDFKLEGRSIKGGSVSLHGADVVIHMGTVDLKGGTHEKPVKINDVKTIQLKDGKLSLEKVREKTRFAVWADVKLNGQALTTNKVFLDVNPWENLAKTSKVSSSEHEQGYGPEKLIDGETIKGISFDASRWSVSGEKPSWVVFDFGKTAKVEQIEINYNTLEQRFYNTPKEMEIQVSGDGQNWTTLKTVKPPKVSAGAHFGYPEIYKPDQPASTRYMRLNFPSGSESPRMDLLEVAIAGE